MDAVLGNGGMEDWTVEVVVARSGAFPTNSVQSHRIYCESVCISLQSLELCCQCDSHLLSIKCTNSPDQQTLQHTCQSDRKALLFPLESCSATVFCWDRTVSKTVGATFSLIIALYGLQCIVLLSPNHTISWIVMYSIAFI